MKNTNKKTAKDNNKGGYRCFVEKSETAGEKAEQRVL